MEDFFYIYPAIATFGCLSFLGSCFIIYIYFKYPSLQCQAFRLVVYLNIFCSCDNIAQVFPSPLLSSPFCFAQALAIQFFSLCHILWTGCIAIILYLQVIRGVNNLSTVIPLLVFGTIFISLCTAIVVFCLGQIGYVGGTCWIDDSETGEILRFALCYIPVSVVIVTMLFMYVKIISKVNNETETVNELIKTKNALVKKLRLYPLVMIVAMVPMIVYRIIQTFVKPLWFYIIALACYNSIGLLNAVVYGFNESVKAEIMGERKSNEISFHLKQIQEIENEYD
jgi:hypothetical protein